MESLWECIGESIFDILPLKVVSFKKVEGAEKRLPLSLESEAAPQGLAEFHVTVRKFLKQNYYPYHINRKQQ